MRGQHHASAAFNPRVMIPDTNRRGGRVDPTAGLDTEVRGKNAISSSDNIIKEQ
jgi:hypothetical protein